MSVIRKKSRRKRMEDDIQVPLDLDDLKLLKRNILAYVKNLTNDLVQGNNLQLPDILGDKVFHAAFLNLRNYLVDVVTEWKSLKKRHKDFQIKIENLTNTVNTCQEQFYVANETIEKLRDEIDLKESNERILQHQLQMGKDSYKDTESRHVTNLKEYDDLTNDMKSQIEALEKKNIQSSGTIEHMQDKLKRERSDVEDEKKALQFAHLTNNKIMKTLERKKSKLKLERAEIENANEQLIEAQHMYKRDIADFEMKLSKLQQERSNLDKEQLAFKKQKSELNLDLSSLEQERFDFGKEKNDLDSKMHNFQSKELEIEKERKELYKTQIAYQIELEDLEKIRLDLNQEKVDLNKAFMKLSNDKNELKKAREALNNEEILCKKSIDDFHTKLVQLTDYVTQEKLKDEKTAHDKLSRQLIESLTKVELLQNNLEGKMKEFEITRNTPIAVLPTVQTVPVTQTHLRQTIPIVSSLPLYPNVIQQNVGTACNLNSNTSNDLDYSINSTALGLNDLSSNSRHVTFLTPQSSDHMYRVHHASPGINDAFESREIALQKKLDRLEECYNVKWDLCRLEAKVADAVLKRSLSNKNI